MTEAKSTTRRWISHVVRAFAALAAVGLVGFAARPLLFGPEIRVVRPMRGDVVRDVVATGRILAPFRV
ncbi:MAG: hypothetical protein GX458_15425, partial [Phyllobacteriaceae bacterium]|nr:hypothetical protein [Phyllobacteriaceae bacterium]